MTWVTQSCPPKPGMGVSRASALILLAALVLAGCARSPDPTPVVAVATATTAATKAETAQLAPTTTPAAAAPSATQAAPRPAPTSAATGAPSVSQPAAVAPEVVVYASELPPTALDEFDFWDDPASPGGRLVGTPNSGGDLDPPPENDPHVTFKVPVQRGIPYRCWIHMKVGPPKGQALANLLWVQFSDAVDQANREILKPGTGSYLTAQGPTQSGWTWVSCDAGAGQPSGPLMFRTSGDVTVRLQAGMEGVGFDQVVLSPARFLTTPPSEAVVKK